LVIVKKGERGKARFGKKKGFCEFKRVAAAVQGRKETSKGGW